MSKPVIQPVTAPEGSLWHSLKMISWAFLGIRKGSDSQNDVTRVNPIQVVGVAIGAVLVVVIVLISIVHWVVLK
ncbi:MAG: DUF2970 domain-containing protein [Rhodoferax sp.]